MKIKIVMVGMSSIFFVHGIFAMQPSCQMLSKQVAIIARLASVNQQIDDQDILEAMQCLKDPLFKESMNEALKENLDSALFRLSRVATGMDAQLLAKILIEAGADPHHEYNIDEEIMFVSERTTFSRTAFSVKTDAKSEARGKVKEYLDSLR